MTVKEKLYRFIVKGPHDLNAWKKFQMSCPQVRIRTVGSKQAVLICLEEHGEWMDPGVWAGNYRASITLRITQEVARAKNILPQKALAEIFGTTAQVTEKVVAPSPAINSNPRLDYYTGLQWIEKNKGQLGMALEDSDARMVVAFMLQALQIATQYSDDKVADNIYRICS